jgi:agmatine deiminase
MPAESEPHERCLMAWPCRAELWGPQLAEAKRDYAAAANAIAAFEPVLMVARPGEGEEARAACAGAVEVIELPIDDSWLRDSGPIVLRGPRGQRAASCFRFNAWGEKFLPYDHDARIARRLAEHLGLPAFDAPLVLEGGSICVDGEGTLLTTEQCLLHPSRNPHLDRDQIEDALREHLGVERVIWLGQGLAEDRDTDGHVDLIAAFIAPGSVLLQTVADEADPNWERCQDNLARLRAARDARGRELEVTELPLLPRTEVAGEPVAVGPLNLYLANGAAIVPVTDAAPGERSAILSILAGAFPAREIVPVPGAVLAYGGGGPHCITQQVPA